MATVILNQRSKIRRMEMQKTELRRKLMARKRERRIRKRRRMALLPTVLLKFLRSTRMTLSMTLTWLK